MSTKNAATLAIVVIAGNDRQQLQYSLNSVALARGRLATPAELFLFDEARLYGAALRYDGQKIPVTHNLHDFTKSRQVALVPAGSMVSSTWLHAASAAGTQHPKAVIRPALYVHYNTAGHPAVRDQSAPVKALTNLYQPFLSGAVLVGGPLLANALQAAPKDYPLSSWLSAGISWLNTGAVHVVPETAVFDHSYRNDHGASYRSLAAFSLHAARQLDITKPANTAAPVENPRQTRTLAARAAKRALVISLRKTHLLPAAKRLAGRSGPRIQPPAATRSALPAWLVDEWRNLHRLDNRIFPSHYVQANSRITGQPDAAASWLAYSYSRLAKQLKKDRYDYILFAPWLIRGGADKFTIAYANTIATNRPDLQVLVVTTLEKHSEWAAQLASNVDYCDFGGLSAGRPAHEITALLELLIGQTGTRALHIINSELAYDFVASHKTWLQQGGIRIAATSFSQEILESGRTLGYSHSHMPEVYDSLAAITSDNKTVLEMWRRDYGFDAAKMALHHLPYVSSRPPAIKPARKVGSPLKVLWAARISVEKMPAMPAEIGKLLQDDDITIDMYGSLAPGAEQLLPAYYPKNVRYLGGFDGLHTLGLQDYDAFLYTSLFDGMPNTLLEIGLHGLPIVSSAVGGIPELIHNGQTGLLVNDIHNPQAYADALRRLQADPAHSRNLAAALQDSIAKTYSHQQFTAAVDKLLKRLGL